MSKPWEMELTKYQLDRFEEILRDLKDIRYDGASSICPFDPYSCNRRKPTCASFVKGLKRNDRLNAPACPCYKFRTASLIWRIEALLEYNKQLRSIHK